MTSHRHRLAPAAFALLLFSAPYVSAQQPAPAAEAPATQTAIAPTAAAQGGTIRGSVAAGSPGKPGGVPLPGVSVTATNTLTGRKYAAATDADGRYAMKIPRNGRYVVKAELAGFAAATQEVVLTGVEAQAETQAIQIVAKATDFSMELASRAAADAARQTAAATSLARGLQGLSLSAGSGADVASTGGGDSGVALPTLAALNDNITGAAAANAGDAITVTGQQGQTSSLANFSEDEIRNRIQDAVAQGQASGMIPQGGDPTERIMGVLGGMMGGGGGGGGRGGGGRGGSGGGFGSGAFRNFNPAQPHGSVFYQGGNSALNASQWTNTSPLTPHFIQNPSSYSNRFGVSIASSPYIPGLTKPNTKQFAFLNLTGQKNLNPAVFNGIVPTNTGGTTGFGERGGDFSALVQPGTTTPVPIYDPRTGQPFPGNIIPMCPAATGQSCISPLAQALLAYYPAPNVPSTAANTTNNYRTISNAGSNNVAINARYNRTLGAATNTPFGAFGGGGGGGRGGRSGNSNAPPSLRQSINLSYNYSHSASDNRNIFLPLGGTTASNGYGLNAGYVIGYGRLSNNASATWNRSNNETRNYFTNVPNDNPSTNVAGTGQNLNVPNQTGGFANPSFYNGLPNFSISGFNGFGTSSPSQTINQTISFSDFISYRHKKHNMRFGFDIRRVHADSIGGNNPLGSYSFTGYATANPATLSSGNAGQTSGNGFADFLLGLPQSTALQAGLYKTYLRENVYDGYVTDDFRVASNWTLNYGLRYEYFGPYGEKYNRLVNLEPSAPLTAPATTAFTPVVPGQNGYPASLVNPDYRMYSPRFGFAYRPKNKGWTKDTVVRGGYGINYNTGQYAIFARSLSHQPPFATTQTNDIPIATTANPNPAATGCTQANLTLANGFGCSTAETLLNNYAVDKNYRLGMVQVYNLNIQRTVPLGIVLNVGYNGSRGNHLDVVGSPNATPSGVSTPGEEPFDYEESAAASRSNQLVVSAQKRQQRGIALGATYTYSHSIDNASGVGGAVGTPIQNLFNLNAEYGNSSFDQRHNLSGNWLIELPFGPNRAYLNKGGVWAYLFDGYSLSGTFTLASGTYFTPSYSGNQTEAASGNTYQQRPDRVFASAIRGAGHVDNFFNTAAFTAPTTNGAYHYGSASPGSIEGPGTVSTNASLSRTFTLGSTRSLEARVTANNVFNTVQYSGINTTQNSFTFGQVTGAATMRTLQVQARYRF